MTDSNVPQYSYKDMASDQEVRWCPGCGDYSILRAVQKATADLGRKREDFVFISGIGCSSRFPYYMETYGMHGIHGRAPAIATGVKLANPDLSVWQITGDGDALAIGGNHFIHAIRRNIDINILLFNNKVYGLTKGQFSPTSDIGFKTKSSPYGNIQKPFNPGELAIGAQGTFLARVIDADNKHMTKIFMEAEEHRGTSLIEILQNCPIFNDKAFGVIAARDTRSDHAVYLEHGKPMIYGKENDKGLVLDGFKIKSVRIGEDGITEDDILVHDAEEKDSTLHLMLAKMSLPDLPMALGVIRKVKEPTFDDRVIHQVHQIKANSKFKSMDDLLFHGETWEIK